MCVNIFLFDRVINVLFSHNEMDSRLWSKIEYWTSMYNMWIYLCLTKFIVKCKQAK